MESAWSNGKAAYRCRYGSTTASAPGSAQPRNAYVREDRILPHLPAPNLLLIGTAGERHGRRTRNGVDTRCQAMQEMAPAGAGCGVLARRRCPVTATDGTRPCSQHSPQGHDLHAGGESFLASPEHKGV
jgi:hypothetical protein